MDVLVFCSNRKESTESVRMEMGKEDSKEKKEACYDAQSHEGLKEERFWNKV